MMKKSKWFLALAILMAMTIILLSGCQLAVAEAAEAAGQDEFIGMYITFESLDTYGLQGSQKIFASQKTEDASDSGAVSYEFPGIEGIAFFMPLVHSPDKTAIYRTNNIGPEVNEVEMTVTDSYVQELKGKIYISPAELIILFPNRVYETADGEVYMVPATGSSMSVENGISASMTLTQDETMTTTINGQTSETTSKAVLTVQIIEAPVQYIVKQFSAEDAVISNTLVTADNIPEALTAVQGMAYAIVETHCAGQGSTKLVNREILDWSSGTYAFLFIDERGFAIGHLTTLGE